MKSVPFLPVNKKHLYIKPSYKFLHILFIIFLLPLAATQTIAQQPLFQFLAPQQTNINFTNPINEDESLNVLAYEYLYNGGAVAVGDINNDGLQDILFTANSKSNKLYLNLGGMKFKDITKETGLEGKPGGWKTGATMADVNGDGLLDIYLCYSGKLSEQLRKNQLFINQGNLKFVEKAKEYGLDDPSYSTQAAFFDFDNDGDLDMFLLNHNVKKYDNMELDKFRKETDELAGNKLYENQEGHFVDVSKKAGIYQNPLTFGLGVAISDVNKDGLQDIYVTNDYNEPDYLYINNGNGTFSDETKQRFRHLSEFSMGVDIADLNNDALPDIITLDMLPEDNRRQKLLQLQENYEAFDLMMSQNLYKQYMRNMFQLNNGDGTFSEIGRLAGISNTDWSWCPLIADFDNDGYKDIFVTTGYLRDYTNKDFLRYWGDYKVRKIIDREPMLLMDLVKAMPTTPFKNYIFKNNHDLTFSNKQADWGFDKTKMSNGAVYADLDNDGDLDLVINNINENAFIYQNMSREQSKTSYLSVQLKGKEKNTAAIGAKVVVYNNGNVQYQEVNPNRGYLSCVSTILNFGLGDGKKVDSLKIIWPDNTAQILTNISANQKLSINNNSKNERSKSESNEPSKKLFVKTDSIINYKHDVFSENDFKRQPLMLFMYSQTEPVIAKGDVNKDGMEEFFITGDKNKPGRIYIQKAGGKFEPLENVSISDENTSAVSAAVFFDANNDGNEDLYVAKGGYSVFEPNTPALQDELYINDGKGHFTLTTDALPDMSACSKSCVRPCDFDGDGDIDLFIGGRVIPGMYPVAPKSFLLKNDGKGKFTAVDIPFATAGMVTDAKWVDLNKDGKKDLILCGEMMPIMVFENTASGFVDKTNNYFSKPESGFWFTLTVADINGDGWQDIVAGNLGNNTQIRASDKEPVDLYYADFDENGSIDPFLTCYIKGVSYPFVSRDELNEQMYSMRKKFTSYKNYADATIQQIFTADELSKANKLSATESRSVVFINKNGKFEKSPLPLQAQFSVVNNIIAKDFTGDGKEDLLLFGNHSDNRLKIGSVDANYGCLLEGDGKGNFSYIDQTRSGLCVKGDVKSVEEIVINKQKYLFIGICDDYLQFYKEP
ncbi:VCBS repeat-containing protein [Segetibacter koreensis]|uniref:VCBS repeat-containing protein n=1 Tax=Segetibacter koreensis TaxID=398037 RepID=UPI0003A60477|nr:VCBS repeat-containing protein [Segetibacter koreensis]